MPRPISWPTNVLNYMKLTITKIYRNNKSKEGVPFVSKKGNPYVKVSIKTQEYGDKWLSGFGGGWNMGWKEGDVVEVEVKPNGEYLNFERLDPVIVLTQRIETLERIVATIKKQITEDVRGETTIEEPPLPEEPPMEEDINMDDIPF